MNNSIIMEKQKKTENTRYSEQKRIQYRELEIYTTLKGLKDQRLGKSFLSLRESRREEVRKKPLIMTSVAKSTYVGYSHNRSVSNTPCQLWMPTQSLTLPWVLLISWTPAGEDYGKCSSRTARIKKGAHVILK